MANKAELLHFLDQNVFNPILHAKPHGHDAKDLQYVQDKTEAEQKRFHGYPSAEEIVKMYRGDLSSEHAKPVNDPLSDCICRPSRM